VLITVPFVHGDELEPAGATDFTDKCSKNLSYILIGITIGIKIPY
jgi:hypothetical protein